MSGPMVPGSQEARPGEPGYISIEEATRRQLERNRAYELLPSTIEKRERAAADAARTEADKIAKSKAKITSLGDYPWLKPDWAEGPVKHRR